MTDIVLVHGGNMSTRTWNLLTTGDPVHTEDGKMGARYWEGTIAALSAENYRVFAPTLTDELTGSLRGHIGEIITVIGENNLHHVMLVGHSYGGMVITGVAAAMANNIDHLVYLDAAVPDPGDSLYSLLKQGMISSGEQVLIPDPAPPYVEPLDFDPQIIRPIPKTYIFCTKSEYSAVTGIARKKIEASPDGWTFVELSSSHVPMADQPEELYRLLLKIASGIDA
ncbi:alpha/beta hydrolase [uncultured Methanospirillum sp.]|uniref:alpha/beta fold hydrolase n=1 Tax=uncultured Methanospirillum sp. TaxID=262503 RepID=UPI0029C8F656|nr:alpha/beta hydrolase [uncultured Methanospirillum sp.]